MIEPYPRMPPDRALIDAARSFAISRHGSQVRKYMGEPYWHHLEEVARDVERSGGTTEMIQAAWLHDILKDTTTTHQEIEQHFGSVVAEYVSELTDNPNPELHMLPGARSLFSPELQTIQLADFVSESSLIVSRDPYSAKAYMQRKYSLLEILKDGAPELHLLAHSFVHSFYE